MPRAPSSASHARLDLLPMNLARHHAWQATAADPIIAASCTYAATACCARCCCGALALLVASRACAPVAHLLPALLRTVPAAAVPNWQVFQCHRRHFLPELPYGRRIRLFPACHKLRGGCERLDTMRPLGVLFPAYLTPLPVPRMQPCPAGTFQPNDGQATCLTCIPGTYHNTSGSISCLLCPLDTFADTYGSPICQVCCSCVC